MKKNVMENAIFLSLLNIDNFIPARNEFHFVSPRRGSIQCNFACDR